MKKKILFVHYRTGERDGVSLEIEKRKKVLEQLGHEVYFLSGFDPRVKNGTNNRTFLVRELDITKKLASFLREAFFVEKILDQTLAWLIYKSEEERAYNQISQVLKQARPDIVFVHNIFSHAFNLPATTALLQALDHYPTKVVAIHHDFFWERPFFQKPRYLFIRNITDNLPPKRDYILYHQVINSFAQMAILEKRGIRAERIKDYFDFTQPSPSIDSFNSDLTSKLDAGKNDLIILHATRITERKAIENSILFTAALQNSLSRLKTPLFLKGKQISSASRVHLLLPNFVEADAQPYFKKLKIFAEEQKVNFHWLGDNFSLERSKINGAKIYSFWDAYALSDLVTYTSFWEGYGNQLLEAIWAKKPIIFFEYPVFKKDISQIGFSVISLGDKMRRSDGFHLVPKEKIARAATEAIFLLQNEGKYRSLVERNSKLAKKSNNIHLLKGNLESLLGDN